MISIICRLISVSIRLKVSPSKSLRLLIATRFHVVDGEAYLTSAMKGIWARWLMFILGPLLAAAKLAVLKGVPGTKFIGFTFLTSFLWGEILLLLAYADMKEHPLYFIPAYRDFDAYLLPLDVVGVFISIAVHLGAIFVVWTLAVFNYLNTKAGHLIQSGTLGPLGGFGMLSVCVLANLALIAGLLRCIHWVIARLFLRWSAVGRLLSVRYVSPDTQRKEVDMGFLLCICAALGNLITLVVGYRFYYDSTGTENPEMTAIFG